MTPPTCAFLLAFGKKAQVGGVMAGPRLDEVADNCFRLPGRINSTWGGNLADMVRATHYLRIIEQERLVENARVIGAAFLEGLRALSAAEPLIQAPRGRGLMLAFDRPAANNATSSTPVCSNSGCSLCAAASVRFVSVRCSTFRW